MLKCAARRGVICARGRAAPRAAAAMAAAQPQFLIAVKGDPATGVLGDCPFSHRCLLTLEEKHVPHERALVAFDAKPQWVQDLGGKVPALRDLATGEALADSGAIADLLEARFPDPPLGTTASAPQVGADVFPAFVAFLTAPAAEEADKRAAFEAALAGVDAHLAAAGGPFIGGAAPCATDLALAPKVYHALTALGHYRGWALPDGAAPALRRWFDAVRARPSWAATHYAPELVVRGWAPKWEAAHGGGK